MSDGTWTEWLGKKIHIDTDNIMVITREKGGWKQAEDGIPDATGGLVGSEMCIRDSCNTMDVPGEYYAK